MTNTPHSLPGWYPDPMGHPGLRYHDGQRWTTHLAPMPPTAPAVAPAPAPSVAVAVSTGGGANHALHAVLTFLSCGLWLPIWILVAIFDSGRGSTAVALGGANASVGTSRNHKPLIAAAIVLGLVIFGVAAQHPWILIPLVLLAGAGGAMFWKLKTAKDREEQERRELYRRDVLADRADYENSLYCAGDPRGMYGRYLPTEYLRTEGDRHVPVQQPSDLDSVAAQNGSAPAAYGAGFKQGDRVKVTASGDDDQGKAGVVDHVTDEIDGFNIYVAFDGDPQTRAFNGGELQVVRADAPRKDGRKAGLRTDA